MALSDGEDPKTVTVTTRTLNITTNSFILMIFIKFYELAHRYTTDILVFLIRGTMMTSNKWNTNRMVELGQ